MLTVGCEHLTSQGLFLAGVHTFRGCYNIIWCGLCGKCYEGLVFSRCAFPHSMVAMCELTSAVELRFRWRLELLFIALLSIIKLYVLFCGFRLLTYILQL